MFNEIFGYLKITQPFRILHEYKQKMFQKPFPICKTVSEKKRIKEKYLRQEFFLKPMFIAHA